MNIGNELVGQILSEFLIDTHERCQKIVEAFAARDFGTIGREAHSLKGAAMTFGAAELVILSTKIENVAEDPEPEKLGASIEALISCQQITHDEFKKRIMNL